MQDAKSEKAGAGNESDDISCSFRGPTVVVLWERSDGGKRLMCGPFKIVAQKHDDTFFSPMMITFCVSEETWIWILDLSPERNTYLILSSSVTLASSCQLILSN